MPRRNGSFPGVLRQVKAETTATSKTLSVRNRNLNLRTQYFEASAKGSWLASVAKQLSEKGAKVTTTAGPHDLHQSTWC